MTTELLAPRVLVVDDDPQTIAAVKDALGDDFAVRGTRCARDAVGQLTPEAEIAVVITDPRLPGPLGDVLLAHVDRRCATQGILLTEQPDIVAIERAVNSGRLFACMDKPWERRELRRTVQSAADRYAELRARALTSVVLTCGLEAVLRREGVRLGRAGACHTSALQTSETLLRKQTSLLHGILDGLGEGVLVTDIRGRFLLCNAEARRMLQVGANGASVASWISICGLHDVDGEGLLPAAADPLVRALRGGERTAREVERRGSHGRPVSIEIAAAPWHDDHGHVAGAVALLCDVTDRRAVQRRLQQTHTMDTMGRLAGGVAHDFNNLLSIIQSCGELLLRQLGGRDALRRDLEHILDATEHAALLTRRLLAFSRRRTIEPETLQLNDVVRSIDAILRRTLGEHIEIVTELESELGYVSFDTHQLEQIILNLAVHARDAMPNGGQLRIETRNVSNATGADERLPAGELVMLAMRDTGLGTGCGLESRWCETPFGAAEVEQGTSLGLATVWGIVEQNAGHVRCECAPQRGTTFEIYLTRIDGHDPSNRTSFTRPTAA